MKFVALLLLTAMLIIPVSASNPEISTWYNNKTNDNDTQDITIYINETIKFNVTANQSIDEWNWTKDGVLQNNNNYDNFTTSWIFNGSYNISVNARNNTNISNTIIWNVTVEEEETKDENATILSWSPQVVDYIYVNDTLNETITYSIITEEPMTEFNWTVDGIDVTENGTTNVTIPGKYNYSLPCTWDNQSLNHTFHTVVFNTSQIEFRWYVNVYEEESYSGGCIFDIIDESLENHAADIKIRMFKRNMNKHNLGVDYFAQKVNRLHDEIAKRQMTREALREEFKADEINQSEYVAALKQAQKDAKINTKWVKNNSNSAKDNSNSAKDNSNSAKDNSNSAKGNSNSAKDNSNSAKDNSNSAKDNSNSAKDNSNSAKNNAKPGKNK